MKHFIDFGPQTWLNTPILEYRTKRDSNASMDDLLSKAIFNNFKNPRIRDHKSITRTADRYVNRRIRHKNKEGILTPKFDSVAAKDEYTNEVVDTIFSIIPQLKGSGALTGYTRYALTNRWTNRKQFNGKDLNKLSAAVTEQNTDKQNEILDYFIKKQLINDAAKQNFLSYDDEKKMRNIKSWEGLQKITNPYYNSKSANEFIEADYEKQLEILKKWAMVTLPTTDPSMFVVRYCNNMKFINDQINDAFKLNMKTSADDIDKQITSGKFERDAAAQGLSDSDKQMAREILASLHDTHKDLRDYTPEEIEQHKKEQDARWEKLVGDINAEEDWSQDEDEDEELDCGYSKVKH